MDSIHGHEVLNMMIESGEQYTHASLEAAIKARFGEQAHAKVHRLPQHEPPLRWHPARLHD
ncbi:DUF2492 family protein, partial [Escherichia coli]|nr:DUF2492 family protein [Escherichia coli]